MRKRIIQLAKGKFETEKPRLELPDLPITFQVVEGKDYTGDFVISCTNHKVLRGKICSTDPRMSCLTQTFEGETVRIRFQYSGKGLEEGRKVSGSFVFVCNQITCRIPYEAAVIRLYYESSCGMIHNLEDFTALAKTNWGEAAKFFYHPGFSSILGKARKRDQMLYQGLYGSANKNLGMEEFLIADERKKPVDFSIEKDSISLYDVEESRRQGLILHKEGWGYLEVDVVSEAPFLRIVKKNITSADFQGGSIRYEFYIDRNRMYEGRNKGRILFSSAYKTLVLNVTASTYPESMAEVESLQTRYYRNLAKITGMYLEFYTRQKPLASWVRDSIFCLDQIRKYSDNPIFLMEKAYILVLNNQFQEADRLLSLFEEENEDDEDRVSNAWMLYNYVCYLLEKNQGAKKKFRARIEEVYHQDMEDDFLFWLVYSMQTDYKNNSVRLQILEKRIRNGSNSPLLYAEAYNLLRREPFLLTKLGSFEIRLLKWAMNHKLTSLNLASQVFELADFSRKFHPVILSLMENYYDMEPREEFIPVICRYLIKGSCYSPRYLRWFEDGISRELRITGLYEAYVQSLDEEQVTELPRILQKYFQFENNLPYQKAAVLYSNIIAAKDEDPEMYQQYSRNMGHFALEQAEAGHVNENLAVIYEDFMDPSIMTDRLAYSFADVLYTCKMKVYREDISHLIVYQWQMKEPQIVPVVNQSGIFKLYTRDFVVVFEDRQGRRYIDTVPCELIRMMDPEPYLETCLQLAPDEISYIVHCFSKSKEVRKLRERNRSSFERLLLKDDINPLFKADLTGEIMSSYSDLNQYPGMKRYLMTVDFERLTQQSRGYLIELMIASDMWEVAYERIREFGSEQTAPYVRAKIYSHMIEKLHGENDYQLTALCAQTFLQGTSNEDMIRYLCAFYQQGPTDVMHDIWEHSSRFRIRTFELEEHILVTALYGNEKVEKYSGLFRHYCESGGRELIIQAFLSVCSQRYFMKNVELDPFIFQLLQKRYVARKDQSDACKLALLKYLSTIGTPDKTERAIEDELLAEFTGRNMNFAFFKNLNEDLILKYHLDDKVFLEYRSKPQTNVYVHVSRDEDGQEFRKEEMHEIYYGIYVKTFVLFFGELIRYYITEETGNKTELMESNRLMPEINGEKKNGRYHMINQMLMSRILWEDDRLLQEMQNYREAESAADLLFNIE